MASSAWASEGWSAAGPHLRLLDQRLSARRLGPGRGRLRRGAVGEAVGGVDGFGRTDHGEGVGSEGTQQRLCQARAREGERREGGGGEEGRGQGKRRRGGAKGEVGEELQREEEEGRVGSPIRWTASRSCCSQTETLTAETATLAEMQAEMHGGSTEIRRCQARPGEVGEDQAKAWALISVGADLGRDARPSGARLGNLHLDVGRGEHVRRRRGAKVAIALWRARADVAVGAAQLAHVKMVKLLLREVALATAEGSRELR